MKMAEIRGLALEKHGGRALNMVREVGSGRETIANWQAVLDTPVDEYAEARHVQGVEIVREKFPEFFGGGRS